jgi:hypothetical protein
MLLDISSSVNVELSNLKNEFEASREELPIRLRTSVFGATATNVFVRTSGYWPPFDAQSFTVQ